MSAPGPGTAVQPESFAFTPENLVRAKRIIAKYPAGRQASAVLPLLDLAQRQHENWLPRAAMDYVAGLLDMASIRVYEVATFYSMFNLEPVGTWFFQICTTTPCWLRGSDAVVKACENKLGVHVGETTPDGKFTLKEVECLGACVNAPIIQVNDDFYEDLDGPTTERLIDELKAGRVPKRGSLAGRFNSAPTGGAQVLKSVPERYGWTLEPPPAPAAPAPGSDD
ncbi:MAG: NADH-quinone oxidoreductase subunit NuoE [Alphaproteobacteria bacterium]|nr:NADH-quinone oxidoreductase subunit NuoE [Alphaproteobacteria bacterium]